MPTKEINHLHISIRTMIWFFVILLGFWVIYIVRDVLFALLFAVIIASAIEPAIAWLKERRVPRILSVIIMYLFIAAILSFILYLVFPLLLDELRGFSATFPILQQQALLKFESISLLPFFDILQQGIEEVVRAPSEYLEKFNGRFFGVVADIFGGITVLILTVVFSFYLALQEKGIENFLRLVSPLEQEPYVIDLWSRAQIKFGRWARTQMLLGAIVGILIFFGLTLLGVEHAILFAVIAAVFEVIPIAGPIFAAVPAVIVAFLTTPILGIATIVLYVVVQQIESHVIVPVVMQKAIGLSPLIVVLAILIGVKLGGIAGLILAVPFTAVFAEFLSDWDKKKRSLLSD